MVRPRLRFEERPESGGSAVGLYSPQGFIEAHVGSPEYVSTHSYAYEQPGLLGYIANNVRDTETIAYIDHVYVEEGRRSRGLGSHLMHRILHELRRRGAVRAFGHMAEWEGDARRRLEGWLRQFGFHVIDCCQEDQLPVVAVDLK